MIAHHPADQIALAGGAGPVDDAGQERDDRHARGCARKDDV